MQKITHLPNNKKTVHSLNMIYVILDGGGAVPTYTGLGGSWQGVRHLCVAHDCESRRARLGGIG